MQFPISFNVSASATKGISVSWDSKAEDLDIIESCIPKEFGGPGKAYSPEDFFALSILNCIIATFKVYMEHSNSSFDKLEASAEAKMDKHSDNFLYISDINIKIDISGASDKEKVKTILEKAIKDCAVSNSVKCGKTYDIKIN